MPVQIGGYRAPRLSPSATVRDVSRVTARLRDPDGSMIEVGQATGVLHGHLAKNALRTFQAELPGCDLAPVAVVHKFGIDEISLMRRSARPWAI
jgi:hypothetical protein